MCAGFRRSSAADKPSASAAAARAAGSPEAAGYKPKPIQSEEDPLQHTQRRPSSTTRIVHNHNNHPFPQETPSQDLFLPDISLEDSLTEEDRQINWKNSNEVTIIPNPITINHSQRATLNEKVVVTAGRLVYQKNFSSLVLNSEKIFI